MLLMLASASALSNAGFASPFAVAIALSACNTSRDEDSRWVGGQLRASLSNVPGRSLSGTSCSSSVPHE